jgi:hypothetical protein
MIQSTIWNHDTRTVIVCSNNSCFTGLAFHKDGMNVM